MQKRCLEQRRVTERLARHETIGGSVFDRERESGGPVGRSGPPMGQFTRSSASGTIRATQMGTSIGRLDRRPESSSRHTRFWAAGRTFNLSERQGDRLQRQLTRQLVVRIDFGGSGTGHPFVDQQKSTGSRPPDLLDQGTCRQTGPEQVGLEDLPCRTCVGPKTDPHRGFPDPSAGEAAFRRLLSTGNMFLIPKAISGAGELPELIEAVAAFERSAGRFATFD